MSATRPTYIVSGFGRCGSSLVMQMLNAGGVRCTGRYPAFEGRVFVPGHATKVLDPHIVGLPTGDVRVIWLDRDVDEQAKSHAKFMAAMAGLQYGRVARRRLVCALKRDRERALKAIGTRPLATMLFEQILSEPSVAAARLAQFTAWPGFDEAADARQVRRRGPACAPDLSMELSLLGAAA